MLFPLSAGSTNLYARLARPALARPTALTLFRQTEILSRGLRYVWQKNASNLLGHHHLDELLVVDLPVTVNVGLADHLVNLLVGQLLTKVGHHVTQLSSGDEAVAVLVEHLEGLLQLLLRVGVLHLLGHQGKELGEIDGAVAVGIDLVDHVLKLGLGGVLAEGAHHGAKLLGGNGAVAILIEEGERLLELSNLLVGKLISHCVRCV
mmetsp:Transcript_5766/g.11783  ORF Transcript_5766/g.11783 Transcript_5766/m.11783 type:complete len:206 (+) Transcript_5766:195-812(+)